MTRISENQLTSTLLQGIVSARAQVNLYGEQISSGVKVKNPGDSNIGGTIVQVQESLQKIEGYRQRAVNAQSILQTQDGVLGSANEVLGRAMELAAQGANETLGTEQRLQMSKEVFQLRDQLVSLANTTYQGKYLYGGAVDNTAPFTAAAYASATSAEAGQRWVYTSADGGNLTKSVQITDDHSVAINSSGGNVFSGAIIALERLGRSLEGYRTSPASGAPDGTGTAYTLPTDRAEQTADIKASLDLLSSARTQGILPERVSVASRLQRLETTVSVLDLSKSSAEEALSNMQGTDMAEAATQLSQAQTALQAALTVSTRLMRQSIMDYL